MYTVIYYIIEVESCCYSRALCCSALFKLYIFLKPLQIHFLSVHIWNNDDDWLICDVTNQACMCTSPTQISRRNQRQRSLPLSADETASANKLCTLLCIVEFNYRGEHNKDKWYTCQLFGEPKVTIVTKMLLTGAMYTFLILLSTAVNNSKFADEFLILLNFTH